MKLKFFVFYILFFIAIFFIFAFALFPEKEIASYLSGSLSNSKTGLSFNNVKPGLPFNLKFESAKLMLGPDLQVTPESFEVYINPFSLFWGKKQIKIQSGFNKGSIEASLLLNKINPFLYSDLKVSMEAMEIEDFRYKTDLADIVLSCRLTGEYIQVEEKDKKVSGKGTILIKDFSADLKNSLFNILKLPLVDFSDIKFEYTRKKNVVTIIHSTARGSTINLNLKGNIEFAVPLMQTRINLKGVLLPDSPYLANFANMAVIKAASGNILKAGIKFNVKGTLGNPKIGL